MAASSVSVAILRDARNADALRAPQDEDRNTVAGMKL
jgi:hypothetical protein